MKAMYFSLIFVAILVQVSQSVRIGGGGSSQEMFLEKCQACEPEKCPRMPVCNLGVVKDRCGCCDVCGLEEFQLCNLPEDWIALAMATRPGYWHGRCGEGLDCRVRKDVDPKLINEKQSICYCKQDGVVCASDGHTYSQCKMQAMQRASNGNITKISNGPCKSEPKILTVTKSSVVKEGNHVSLACEVQGFPIPTVSWYFNRPNLNENIRLPGDAEEISVSVRGGPQITRMTSHLQIVKTSLKHEGVYKCMAENDLGMQMGSISLTVIPDESKKQQNNDGWFSTDAWVSDEM